MSGEDGEFLEPDALAASVEGLRQVATDPGDEGSFPAVVEAVEELLGAALSAPLGGGPDAELLATRTDDAVLVADDDLVVGIALEGGSPVGANVSTSSGSWSIAVVDENGNPVSSDGGASVAGIAGRLLRDVAGQAAGGLAGRILGGGFSRVVVIGNDGSGSAVMGLVDGGAVGALPDVDDLDDAVDIDALLDEIEAELDDLADDLAEAHDDGEEEELAQREEEVERIESGEEPDGAELADGEPPELSVEPRSEWMGPPALQPAASLEPSSRWLGEGDRPGPGVEPASRWLGAAGEQPGAGDGGIGGVVDRIARRGGPRVAGVAASGAAAAAGKALRKRREARKAKQHEGEESPQQTPTAAPLPATDDVAAPEVPATPEPEPAPAAEEPEPSAAAVSEDGEWWDEGAETDPQTESESKPRRKHTARKPPAQDSSDEPTDAGDAWWE